MAYALPHLPAAPDARDRIEAALGSAPIRLRTARELARDALRPVGRARPTALATLDRLLDGGLPRGELVEMVGRRSSGRYSIVLAALAAATGGGLAAALVDLGGNLDPALADHAGIHLERLLWVRPERLRQALVAAEMLLDGGFPLVVLDAGAPPIAGGRGPESAWLRLNRAAAACDATLLLSSPYRISGTAATSVLSARRGRSLWLGAGRSPRLLAGLRPRLTVEKLAGRPADRSASLDPLSTAERIVPPPVATAREPSRR